MSIYLRRSILKVAVLTPLSILLILTKNLAQDSLLLTLDAAIAIALKNNFDIRIAQNDVQIAKNNAVKGNAGFLPTINLAATEQPSVGYLNQRFANGNEINRANLSNNLNSGVAMSWTLYDGKRMYLELDRLKELQAIGEVAINIRTEQLIYDVMRAYYTVVFQQELYNGLRSQLDLYEERLRLAQTQLDVGKGNQLDVFQAQSDLNVQKTQLLRQRQAIDIAVLNLKRLFTEGGNANYVVRDTLTPPATYDLTALADVAKTQSPQLLLLRKQAGISILTMKQAETLRKPRLTLNSNFNLARTDNTAGFFLVNQNAGLNAGITLTYPLYDGGNIKRQIENSKIDIESNKIRIEQFEQDIQDNLMIAYQNLQNALEILKAEDNNRLIAKKSIDIAMERYRLSRSTILELKQIQQTYESAIIRSISSRLDAKLAEVELLRWSGQLVRK